MSVRIQRSEQIHIHATATIGTKVWMLIRSTPTKPYMSYNIEVSADLFSLVSLLMDQKFDLEHENSYQSLCQFMCT